MARSARNAKKKLARKILQSYSAAGFRKSGTDLAERRVALSEASILFLDSCQVELNRRAALLGRRGCWQLLEELREQATLLGVLPELSVSVSRAASRFMGRSVVTMNHSAV